MEILCSFRLVVEEKIGKEIPEPSRLEFLEKFLASNFALSDAKKTPLLCNLSNVVTCSLPYTIYIRILIFVY